MTAPEKAPLTATPSSEGPVTDDKKLHQNADTIFVLRHSGFLRHSSFVLCHFSSLRTTIFRMRGCVRNGKHRFTKRGVA